MCVVGVDPPQPLAFRVCRAWGQSGPLLAGPAQLAGNAAPLVSAYPVVNPSVLAAAAVSPATTLATNADDDGLLDKTKLGIPSRSRPGGPTLER